MGKRLSEPCADAKALWPDLGKSLLVSAFVMVHLAVCAMHFRLEPFPPFARADQVSLASAASGAKIATVVPNTVTIDFVADNGANQRSQHRMSSGIWPSDIALAHEISDFLGSYTYIWVVCVKFPSFQSGKC